MPKVNIELLAATTPEARVQISDAVHDAMVQTLGTAGAGRFHLFTEVSPAHQSSHPDARPRGANPVFLTFYLAPRPHDVITSMIRAVVGRLEEKAGFAREEVGIIVVDVPSNQWFWEGKDLG